MVTVLHEQTGGIFLPQKQGAFAFPSDCKITQDKHGVTMKTSTWTGQLTVASCHLCDLPSCFSAWAPFCKRGWRHHISRYGCGPDWYPSSWRETKFCYCLFTSFKKREIRHFHVVVMQWRQRNVQKQSDARAELLFCLVKLLLFFTSRRRCILNFLLFAIHCDPSETELSQCKLNCSCW